MSDDDVMRKFEDQDSREAVVFDVGVRQVSSSNFFQRSDARCLWVARLRVAGLVEAKANPRNQQRTELRTIARKSNRAPVAPLCARKGIPRGVGEAFSVSAQVFRQQSKM